MVKADEGITPEARIMGLPFLTSETWSLSFPPLNNGDSGTALSRIS